ncbi:hypothetical protein OH146_01525 [Salinibacterium sp. SYSU T00001]|uniref:hypothetical protein n=1 Tax=Homoserinimonas sedimenticola TaxID=2986805 RepID=UPI002236AD9B|nr:hypothetical protein [Salinibacterium sedimenticola]MCW4384449.1 hypothetical protein [Salinibacterium sedimenticola]
MSEQQGGAPERKHDDIKNENESTEIERDVVDSPRSERDVQELQRSQIGESPALDDPDIDESDVDVLPGTGGQDDQGDVNVAPGDVNMPRDTGAH